MSFLLQSQGLLNGSAVSYTLSASPGSFTLTGQPAGLVRSLRLTAAAGAYALAGQPATLARALRLLAAGGAYAVTGQPANLRRSLRLVASSGSLALAGTPAGMVVARRIAGNAGILTLSGSAANLTLARRLLAASGAYALTGQPATLTKTSAGATLLAESGSYTITGSAVNLTLTRKTNETAAGWIHHRDRAAIQRQLAAQTVTAQQATETAATDLREAERVRVRAAALRGIKLAALQRQAEQVALTATRDEVRGEVAAELARIQAERWEQVRAEAAQIEVVARMLAELDARHAEADRLAQIAATLEQVAADRRAAEMYVAEWLERRRREDDDAMAVILMMEYS